VATLSLEETAGLRVVGSTNGLRSVSQLAKLFSLATVAVVLVSATSCGSSSPKRSSLVASDVAVQAGIAAATNTHGNNCVADLDADGIPDLLLNNHGSVWPLLKGAPDGRFVPYYKGLMSQRADFHGCAVADFNGDGLLDIYMAVGSCKGGCADTKQLWIQKPDHTFVEEARQFGIDDPGGRGRVPVVLNANGDKRPDLFTGQEVGVKYPSMNRLWIDEGNHFVLQKGPITNNLGDLCSAAADINGDGYDELALCTPTHGFFIFKRDAHGIYQVATSEFGVSSVGKRKVVFADLNGDGRPDLATVTQTAVNVYLNEGGKYGKPVFTQKVSDGMDVAFGDVNGDGTLDMFLLQGGTKGGQIFLNEGGGLKWKASLKLPAPPKGAGDAVDAIPNYKGSHRAAFVVNNGYENAVGTRQLWVFSGT
jgi:hypothetical protein